MEDKKNKKIFIGGMVIVVGGVFACLLYDYYKSIKEKEARAEMKGKIKVIG